MTTKKSGFKRKRYHSSKPLSSTEKGDFTNADQDVALPHRKRRRYTSKKSHRYSNTSYKKGSYVSKRRQPTRYRKYGFSSGNLKEFNTGAPSPKHRVQNVVRQSTAMDVDPKKGRSIILHQASDPHMVTNLIVDGVFSSAHATTLSSTAVEHAPSQIKDLLNDGQVLSYYNWGIVIVKEGQSINSSLKNFSGPVIDDNSFKGDSFMNLNSNAQNDDHIQASTPLYNDVPNLLAFGTGHVFWVPATGYSQQNTFRQMARRANMMEGDRLVLLIKGTSLDEDAKDFPTVAKFRELKKVFDYFKANNSANVDIMSVSANVTTAFQIKHFQLLKDDDCNYREKVERFIVDRLLRDKGVVSFSSYSLYFYVKSPMRRSNMANGMLPQHINQQLGGYSINNILNQTQSQVPTKEKKKNFLKLVNKSYGMYMERYILRWMKVDLGAVYDDAYNEAANVNGGKTVEKIPGLLGLIPDAVLKKGCMDRWEIVRNGTKVIHFKDQQTKVVLELKASIMGYQLTLDENYMDHQHYFQMQLYMDKLDIKCAIYIQYCASVGMVWRLVQRDDFFLQECQHVLNNNINELNQGLNNIYNQSKNEKKHKHRHKRLQYLNNATFKKRIKENQCLFYISLLNLEENVPVSTNIYYPLGKEQTLAMMPMLSNITPTSLHNKITNTFNEQW